MATSGACANQAFLFANHVVGLQFHLEMTREGMEMLIRHCQSELVPGNYVQQTHELLREPFALLCSPQITWPTAFPKNRLPQILTEESGFERYDHGF